MMNYWGCEIDNLHSRSQTFLTFWRHYLSFLALPYYTLSLSLSLSQVSVCGWYDKFRNYGLVLIPQLGTFHYHTHRCLSHILYFYTQNIHLVKFIPKFVTSRKKRWELIRFSLVLPFSSSVFEISIWYFVHVLFCPKNCSFVRTVFIELL